MNSYETAGIKGREITTITNRLMEYAIKTGIEAGIKAGTEQIEKEKEKARKDRYDRRLHNTRLLLKNYRVLVKHTAGAIYNSKQMRNESAVDILDGLDSFTFNDNLYIESISTSRQRTMLIIEHIDQMLRYYKIDCEHNGTPEDRRRYEVVMAMYINEPKQSVEEIADTFGIERRTVYKDLQAALKPLTALLFGIDSLKVS